MPFLNSSIGLPFFLVSFDDFVVFVTLEEDFEDDDDDDDDDDEEALPLEASQSSQTKRSSWFKYVQRWQLHIT